MAIVRECRVLQRAIIIIHTFMLRGRGAKDASRPMDSIRKPEIDFVPVLMSVINLYFEFIMFNMS